MGRFILLALMLIVACSHPETPTLKYSELREYIFGTDPLSHTVYTGSDDSYHYFRWSKGKTTGSGKIPKDQLNLAENFDKNSGKTRFLVTDSDGNISLLRLTINTEQAH